jgi:hypothetical protein
MHSIQLQIKSFLLQTEHTLNAALLLTSKERQKGDVNPTDFKVAISRLGGESFMGRIV